MWDSRSKICKIAGKLSFKFWKSIIFEGEQPNYLHIFLNISEITKFDEIINSEKVYCQGHHMHRSYYKWL